MVTELMAGDLCSALADLHHHEQLLWHDRCCLLDGFHQQDAAHLPCSKLMSAGATKSHSTVPEAWLRCITWGYGTWTSRAVS